MPGTYIKRFDDRFDIITVTVLRANSIGNMQYLGIRFYFIVDEFVLDIKERYDSLREFYQIDDKQIEVIGGNKEDALKSLILEKVATLEL